MKRSFQLLLICFTLVATSAFAQETGFCNNYLDDDGDGFIDCFDSDCSNDPSGVCKDFYLGNDAACTLPDPPSKKFTMKMDFASPNETTNHLSRMAIGDLNRDGVPEIVTMNRYTKRVFILNGNDGTIQSQATVVWEPQWEIAIANINNDGCAEIFFFGVEGGANYIYAYDCNLNFIWRSAQKLRGDPINYGIADFDGDGKIEIYVKDEILDAHTGIRIVKSTAPTWNRINGGPVAVDMDNDNKLDLVIGLAIYKVNLGARTADAGSLTLFKSHPSYFVRYEFNATSVADYNLDGNLDVIASGSTIANGTNTTVFFWDVANNTVKTFSDPIAGNVTLAGCPASTGTYYQNGWQNGTGRINLADLDGDGKMNASYVSGKYLYALNENFNLLWRTTVNEETSGYTGCTLFDFNGDGQSEIVYRDEKFIYIINGIDGSVNTQQACVSRTNREYPIVADVDADGSTEICVTCGFDDALAVANFCSIGYSQYSHVRVFKSASEPWVAARRLWNQHGYFNVNVNNDLTIPRVQQKHHLAFSATPCKLGQNVLPRPLNNFLNQSPYLDSKGCQVNVAPDLGFTKAAIQVIPPTCPEQNFTVSFAIQNYGNAPISGDLPITFYSGNPNKVGATKLNTITETLNSLGLNDSLQIGPVIVNGLGSAFELFIALNDDGTSVPTPIALTPDFIECNYFNNIDSADVVPAPAIITALKINENIVCSPSPSPPNGAVRAFILTGGVENTIDYNFYWSIGSAAKPIPADFIGPVYTGLIGGDYTVFAIHKTANCGSNASTVSLDPAGKPNTIGVSINLLSADNNCQNPNGSLQAVVSINGVVQPVNDFTYQWFDGPFVITGPLIGVADIVANLKGGKDYAVLVKEKATGCEGSLPFFVPDNTAKPVAQATVIDIVCSSANSGSAAATVDVGGVNVTTGFTFNWYRGSSVKPTTDFPAPAFTSTTTGIISNQPAGFYTVVAVNNVTFCESIPVIVEIKQTPPFVVSVTKTSDQTSCDMTQLNGAAFATPSIGAIADYTFEWFKGQNTLPLNFIDSTSNTIAGLDVGIYTVRAKHRITKCTDTEEVTINFAVVSPIIQSTTNASSSKCSPPDGSAEVTALIPAGAFSDYTFEWYNGPIVDPATLMADTDEKITGLTPGDYTVKATNNITHCVTPPKTIPVGNILPVIQIDSTTINYPNKCDDFGSIAVIANAPGNTLGFDFVWHRGQLPFQALPGTAVVIPTSSTTSTLTQILTGAYTVVVTDRSSGCSSSRYFLLPFDGGQILFRDFEVPITTCSPGTGGEIHGFLVKPVIIPSESDYDIEVYKGTNDLFPATPYRILPGAPTFALVDLPGDPLLPGFYTFVGVLKSNGCRSVPLTRELKVNTLNPAFTSAITDNVNCSPGINPLTGQILLTISPPVAPDPITTPADYDFVWSGPTATSPVLPGITTNVAPNLGGGIYTVNVKTKAGLLYAGCSTTQTFQVFDRAPIVSMAVTTIPKTDCLLPATAGASVITILEDGVSKFPVPGVDYPLASFQWFDNTQTVIPTGIGSSITGLIPSTYSVRATNANNNCFSEFMFEIIDETIGDINVDLVSSINPTRCLLPINSDGDLLVNAVDLNDPAATYTYDWYDGINLLVPPILPNNPHLIGKTVPPGQTDITFTVKSIKNSTQCFATATYTLPLETAPILLSASANPVTYCVATLDGSVFATITNGNQNLYTYDWTGPTGSFTILPGPAAAIPGLDSGTYIVRASQPDVTCFVQDTVRITNDRIFPNLLLEVLRSLSICDLMVAPADGVAQASIEGDSVTHYEIDWFRNGFPPVVDPTPVPSPFAFGSQVGSLADSTYYVVAFDLVSRCLDSAKIKIPFVPLPIPFPQIDILSMVTSCVDNNGALAVSVNGNTKDYTFDWTGPNLDVPTTGEMIDSLAVGTYTVTATSRITGCVSVPVSAEIIAAPVYPDFNFKIEPATCDQEDGYLTLFMTTDVSIASIVWTSGSNTYTGPNVINAPAGDYTVVVTTELGCETTKSVTLLTEIRPYNGISRNGDGKNDFFLIDCIQNFENNVVKIFNRAGTLVYEASGYNNTTILFDGVSNKGISLMGTKLPDGTYFYVIDKQDGSKALAGYLEIVN